MAEVTRSWCVAAALVGVLLAAGCGETETPPRRGGGDQPEGRSQPENQLADGPVTVVALGDSLTSGDGDESGQGGYAARLVTAIDAIDGRAGSSLVNLAVSGWDSTMMVAGGDGAEAQLAPAVDAVRGAVDEGRAVIATILIGSNDLWYTYEYSEPSGATAEDEDAAAEVYGENLDRAVAELTEAGATVVVGLPDDQSLRPGAADIERLNTVLPYTTAEEVQQMSGLAARFGDIVVEVAAKYGALRVDTNDSFWADEATMAEDGIHPNSAGHDRLAQLWLETIGPLLDRAVSARGRLTCTAVSRRLKAPREPGC